MRKTIIGFVFIIGLSVTGLTQTKEARMIDKVESYTCEEMKARLDNFGNAVNGEPNSLGYVIVYEGKYGKYVYTRNNKSKFKFFLPTFGEAVYRTQQMQKYFFAFRGFSKQQFLFIDGGFRENSSVEFWIVPKTATAPKPTQTLKEAVYRKGKPIEFCEE